MKNVIMLMIAVLMITAVQAQEKVKNSYIDNGDGFNTDIGNNSSPIFFSAPTITNLTINGLGSSNENEAVRLRAGTRAVISNVLIEGFAEGFDLDDTETGDGVLTGDTSITDVTFDDVTLNLRNDTEADFEEGDVISGIGNGIGADYDSWNSGWTRD